MTTDNLLKSCSIDAVPKIVLGSRSPRRRELLGSIVGHDRLLILPPASPYEPGFSDVCEESVIERRLNYVVHLKQQDVCRQLAELPGDQPSPFVIVADTIVIAQDEAGTRRVLGQPGVENWEDDVRTWFRQWLSGRTHDVWTGFLISREAVEVQFIVRSNVTFGVVSEEQLDWYIATRESPGKAGGYAIQGHAAAFVTRLEGSLTNVIGLPLMEVMTGLTMLGWRRGGL